MSRRPIKTTAVDFCGNPDLHVWADGPHGTDDIKIPALVSLKAGGGPCYFQFSMTADGARALAELLTQAAAEIDAIDALEGTR